MANPPGPISDPLLEVLQVQSNLQPHPTAPTAPSSFSPPQNPPHRRLHALSDLHLSYRDNREALKALLPQPPGDGLILCGDVGETTEHLELAFAAAKKCFEHVWWVPGNHELYTMPAAAQRVEREEREARERGESGGGEGGRGEGGGRPHGAKRGVEKYEECVEVARRFGVLTPEDEFMVWTGAGGPCVIAPVFVLYDYSFRPEEVSLEGAVDWARETNVEATDEVLLHPDPYKSREEWCEVLVKKAEERLQRAVEEHPGVKLVIAGHWPLREDVFKLFTVPRFCIWCGTKKTEDWHTRFNAKVVVGGHIHIRRTDWRDGVRFEEVSLGYPRQWKECREKGMDINDLLREILPGPESMPEGAEGKTIWRQYG